MCDLPFDLTSLFQAITAIGTLTAAIYSANAARSVRTQTKASVQLSCLSSYTATQQNKLKASQSSSPDLCKAYFRELFDLHWAEHQLWKANSIDDPVMKTWLNVRFNDYKNKDSLIIKDKKGKKLTITYPGVWDDLIRTEYFKETDDFVKLMILTHEGKIDEALRLKNSK